MSKVISNSEQYQKYFEIKIEEYAFILLMIYLRSDA